jgi:hypothetical protein
VNEVRRVRRWGRAAGAILLVAAAVAAAVALTRHRPDRPHAPARGADAVASAAPPRVRPVLPTVRQGTGPHTVRGQVVDAGGNPVAGAAVIAEFELGPGIRSLPGAPALPAGAAGQDAGQDAGPGLAHPVIEARSDGEGRFELRGLDTGRYRFRVEGPALVTAEVRFVDVPLPELRLLVARRVKVVGMVIDGARPVAGAEVWLRGQGMAELVHRRTDRRGQFQFDELVEGLFEIWAVHGERAAPVARVERVGGELALPVVLSLVPAAVVRGRVIDGSTGQGLAAVLELSSDSEPSRFARSDASGNFEAAGVLPGRWYAGAFAPGYIATEALSFEVAVGARAVTPVIELHPGSSLGGVVVDEAGAPVAGAVLSVVGKDEAARSWTINQDTLRERLARHGNVRLAGDTGSTGERPAPGQFISRGELGVLVGPIPFPPPPGATLTRVATPLLPPGSADPEEAPLPVREELASIFVTDASGQFRVTGLYPGNYRVVATHVDHADSVSAELSVQLGEQRSDLRLVLPSGAALVGQVTDENGTEIAGATIRVRPDVEIAGGTAPEVTGVTGPDGRYRVGRVAGALRVTVSAPGHAAVEQTLRLPAARDAAEDHRLDVVLERAEAGLTGTVKDPDGTGLAGASIVVRGKRLVGERRVRSDDQGRFELGQLPRGSLSLRVEHPAYPPLETTASTRDDRPLELVLSHGGGISLEVRDGHSGAPLAQVRVEAHGPAGARATAVTDAQGAAQLVPLPVGRWTLHTAAPGFATRETAVRVPAAATTPSISVEDLVIELHQGAVLAGTVRDRDGNRIAGARLQVGGARATSNRDGEFELRDVPTGEVELVARKGGLAAREALSLSPGDEQRTLEIVLE